MMNIIVVPFIAFLSIIFFAWPSFSLFKVWQSSNIFVIVFINFILLHALSKEITCSTQ